MVQRKRLCGDGTPEDWHRQVLGFSRCYMIKDALEDALQEFQITHC